MTNQMKKISRFALTTSAGSVALGMLFAATPGYAQTAPADEADSNVIIVTGSRIARPDLTADSPISIVNEKAFELKAGSANVEQVLNDMPQITATTSSTSNNPGGGVATVNLRNLGSQRTLVLVDGKRYMSYDVTQVVDLNTIPSALIQSVDVLTGGSSAVYGSDAIAGVVNFRLKRDFEGVEVGSSYDVTSRGDGQVWDVYGVIGSNFDEGRGNVTVYGEYTKRKATFAGDRSFARNALSDINGELVAAGGSPSVPQTRVNIPGLGAASGLGCDIQDFTDTGANRCYVAANGYNFAPINYLQVPQERFTVSAMGQYEINEHFTPYFEAQFVNNRVTAQLAATPISNGSPYRDGTIGALTIQTNSPFLSPGAQAAFAALDTDGDGYVQANSWNFRTVQIGPRANFDERNAFRVVGGMKGDIAAGFSYDGYYMYSRTKNSQRQLGNVAIDRFLDATTTAFDGNGNLVCASGNSGCAPANIFGQGNLSQAAIDYISIGATNLEQYVTQVASLSVSNPDIVDFGAGGVGLAFGAEWRSESGSVSPDQYLSSGNVAGFNPGQPTAGRYSVREFFGELRVPLIKDSFIHSLELNGAARASKYSNAPGNVFTWAAGAQLSPVRDITFRGNYQKAVRGPSVNELYLGNTVSFAGNADQCGTAAAVAPGQLRDICLAQGVPTGQLGNPAIQDPNQVNPLTFLGGNANLREETAKTYTFGVVFAPTFAPRFHATIDYYHVRVTNAIFSGVGTQVIGNQCFIRFDQDYCSLITRNPVGEIDTFSDLYTNSGKLVNAGIDVSADYSIPLGALLFGEESRLSFDLRGTYLTKSTVTPVVGLDPSTTVDCQGRFGVLACGVPTPKWRHTFRTTLDTGPVTLSVMWRYLGKAKDDDPGTVYASETLKAQNYFDLTGQVEVNENFTLTGGVNNMFDKKPPLSASAQNGGNGEQSNTYPTLYDVLGRSFFISGKMKF